MLANSNKEIHINGDKKLIDITSLKFLTSIWLLIHGLKETKTKDTDEIVLDVISNKLHIKKPQISIDRSHRLGKQKGPGQKSQAIIVKFT